MQKLVTEPIYTLKHLSIFLGIPLDILTQLVDTAPKQYRPYKKQKKSGGYRTIDNPSELLKEPQRRIKERLLELHPLPKEILGGVKGYGIKDYAAIHVGQPEVICLDIKNCFPSVTNDFVFQVFRNNYAFSENVASALTKLTTFRGRLPQGAPTSNLLLNIIVSPLCEEIAAVCAVRNLRHSFWVDDVTLSGEKASDCIQSIVPLFHKHGFALKTKKTEVMPRSGRQSALSLVVNNKVSVSSDKYDKFIRDTYDGLSKDQLSGRANHLEYVNPAQAARFIRFAEKRLQDRSYDVDEKSNT